MDISSEFICVKNRPVPKEPFHFFSNQQNARYFLTITDKVKIWQDDLAIAERLFADMIVCPFTYSYNSHKEAIEKTKDILKQRMKHPDIKQNPELESIAKIWILPQKLSIGPNAHEFLACKKDAVKATLFPYFESIQSEPLLHFLKVEVDDGLERPLLYSILDSGFRPSLVLVKWTNDLDEDIATANCAGHLINTGYSLVCLQNGYALYYFADQPLYDICSMKNPSLKNPFMESLFQSMSKHIMENKS